MKTVAVIQPIVPHYRHDFFSGISKNILLDVYCYDSIKNSEQSKLSVASFATKKIKCLKLGPFYFYNLFPLIIGKKYSTIVLMLNFSHITNWLVLLTKFIHKKEIILWGHGISVKRYVKEEKKPDILLKFMIFLSDGVWLYTEKELNIWKKYFPKKNMVSLNNTISEVDIILNSSKVSQKELKIKFNLAQEIVIIFCARFNTPYRKIDILVNVIEKLDNKKFGFIIVGDGPLKPDFSRFENVYDFGAVYDRKFKDELFQMSDIYFQPGWVGLSIVEAMAYGKPVFTLKRTLNLLQCVEYSYIIDGYNGKIFSSLNHFLLYMGDYHKQFIEELSRNSVNYTINKLSMNHMVSQAISSLKVN